MFLRNGREKEKREMPRIRVIINGREVLAQLGVTILDAAHQADIDIPTLCHHRALMPIGACRICVVEVKGQRNLQAACAFPISEIGRAHV